MKFKVGLALLALVGAGLGLTACGGGAVHVASTPSVSQSSQVAALTPDQRFINDIHAENTNSILTPNNELVSIASTVCNTFDNGWTPLEVVEYYLGLDQFTANGWSPTEIGYFIGHSALYYCPQYGPEIKAAASSQEAQTTTS